MPPEDDDIAAQKAEEDAKAAEAKAKADADAAKAKADADAAAKAEEDKKKAAPQNNALSEEQWVALEKGYGLPRTQILANWSMIQAAAKNNPANKLLEKDAWGEATRGVKDIAFYEAEAKKAVEELSPEDRMNPKKVREKIMSVRGEKMDSAQGGGARRVASGFDSGGSGDRTSRSQDNESPDFSGLPSDVAHDEQEVFTKFGFTSKKDFESMKKKEINIEDGNFVPKWK